MKDTKKWEDYDTLVLPDGTEIDMLKLLNEQDRAKAALAHIEPFFAGLIGKVRFVYTFHVEKVPREELEVETVLGTLDTPHKVPWHPGLPGEEHRVFRTTSSKPLLPS